MDTAEQEPVEAHRWRLPEDGAMRSQEREVGTPTGGAAGPGAAPSPTTLVYAIGDPDQGDAAAGWLVADLLEGRAGLEVHRVVEPQAVVAASAGWSGEQPVVLVGAVRTGAGPGTVHRWDLVELLANALADVAWDRPDAGLTSRLADVLARAPHRVTVVGIEGSCFARGAPPSHPVLLAAEEVAADRQLESPEGMLAVDG